MSKSSKIQVHGHIGEGYEAVEELFEDIFTEKREVNAQLCVYVNGELEVDLWGTSVGEDSYDANQLHLLFCSSKPLCAIAIACLVSKGLIKYSDRVCEHWPEFGQNGKENIRIEDVLRHEAGMAWFDHTFTPENIQSGEIRANSIGKVVEVESLRFPPKKSDTIREYHVVTSGWILNEIFRRVEPSRRTMGMYFREVIRRQLGVDIFIGLLESELSRCQKLSTISAGKAAAQSLIPQKLDKRGDLSLVKLVKVIMALKKGTKKEGDLKPPPPLKEMDTIPKFMESLESPVMLQGEIPSCNACSTARSLARLAACVVNKGELDGVRIFSEEAYEQMHDDYTTRKDWGLGGAITEFSKGGINRYRTLGNPSADNVIGSAMKKNRDGFVGWFGYGGSVLQWHPELKIGFAFVSSKFSSLGVSGNPKAGELQAKVVECTRIIKKRYEGYTYQFP